MKVEIQDGYTAQAQRRFGVLKPILEVILMGTATLTLLIEAKKMGKLYDIDPWSITFVACFNNWTLKLLSSANSCDDFEEVKTKYY